MMQDNLTTSQAGKIADKCSRTIVNWIHKGWLKAKKLPGPRGPYRIDESELRETMKQRYTALPYDPEGKLPEVSAPSTSLASTELESKRTSS